MQRKHEDRKLGALESSLPKQQNLSSQSRNLLLQPWESHPQTTRLSRELVTADAERMVQIVSLLLLYKNVGQYEGTHTIYTNK